MFSINIYLIYRKDKMINIRSCGVNISYVCIQSKGEIFFAAVSFMIMTYYSLQQECILIVLITKTNILISTKKNQMKMIVLIPILQI